MDSDSARKIVQEKCFSFRCSISKVAKIVAQSPKQNDHFFSLYADSEISPIYDFPTQIQDVYCAH